MQYKLKLKYAVILKNLTVTYHICDGDGLPIETVVVNGFYGETFAPATYTTDLEGLQYYAVITGYDDDYNWCCSEGGKVPLCPVGSTPTIEECIIELKEAIEGIAINVDNLDVTIPNTQTSDGVLCCK